MPKELAIPLSQRTGGHLDDAGDVAFQTPLSARSEATESAHLLDAHSRMASQMQQSVEQHRAVAVREHDTDAVRPFRTASIELQVLRVQRRRDLCHAKRDTLVSLATAHDGVNGKEADRVRPLGARSAGG